VIRFHLQGRAVRLPAFCLKARDVPVGRGKESFVILNHSYGFRDNMV